METDHELAPLEEARRRGEEHKEELAERAGGLWSREQVADHLGIPPDEVEERRCRGSLLAVQQGGSYGYPACQFEADGVVEGLPAVLRSMAAESGWTKLSLLYSTVLKGEAARENLSILEAVKQGHQEAALHAASTWGEQGAL